jgi:MFS family permease
MARLYRALRHRNYRLFFIGQGISLVGTWLTRFATSWLAYKLTHSGTILGLVSFFGQMPSALLSPIAGVLVDRFDRHRVIVRSRRCCNRPRSRFSCSRAS